MTIMTVVGARPQFIKAAVVSRAIAAEGSLNELLVHTGQHYDASMSDVFFDELGLPAPTYHLGIGSGPHGEQTGRMLAEIERVILERSPDLVLVYGDTNSTLAGALAASKLHVPVAHVEAGLRSFNRRMPEEVNRVLTDHVSDVLFAPTEVALHHLRNEGISADRIVRVGDVMLDAARVFTQGREAQEEALLKTLGIVKRGYALATVHRAENTDVRERLDVIQQALAAVSKQMPVLLPLHPRTRKALSALGFDPKEAGVQVLDPLGYPDMALLLRNARLVLTDSGGVQKEAFFHGAPCVTLRNETEWTELVALGWNRLAPPTDVASILLAVERALAEPGRPGNPYGDGYASEAIVANLAARYSGSERPQT